MASQIWWGGGGPPAHANIEIDKAGKITVYSGTQDLGTGTYLEVIGPDREQPDPPGPRPRVASTSPLAATQPQFRFIAVPSAPSVAI